MKKKSTLRAFAGTEAKNCLLEVWLGSQISWEARSDWLGSQIGWEDTVYPHIISEETILF